jgi:parvulin-like peptidyl-prolyl isomerase
MRAARRFQKSIAICLVLVAVFSLSSSFVFAAQSRKVPLRIIIVKSPSEAKDILSRLKKGVPFTRLAAERSLDKSRGRSGDLGTVDVSRLEPPLRKEVAKMQEGDTSGAIRLRKNKYAIVQVLDLSHYRKGAAAFRAGDFTSAETDLIEHLRQNPDAVKARIMLGEIQEQRKDFEKAEAHYKAVLSYDIKSWIAYVRLGKLYMQNAEYRKARDIYAQGLRYIPKAEGFRTGMKDAEARLAGAPAPEAAPAAAWPAKEAAPTPPAAVELAPPPPSKAVAGRTSPGRAKDSRSMHLRMVVLGSESEAGEVLSDLKKGKSFAVIAKDRSIDERTRGAFGYLGEVEIGTLDMPIQDAVRNLKVGQVSEIIKLGEGRYAIMQSADFHYFKEGEKAFIKEDFKTAEKKLLKHLELNEDDAGAHLMLGAVYEERKDYKKAEEIFEKGISYHPKVVLLYLRLGKLYQAQRQFQKSKDVFVEGFRNVPSSEPLAKGIEMVDILLYNESQKKR